MSPVEPRRDSALAEVADLLLRIGRELEPHGPDGVVDLVPLTGTEAAVLRWIHRSPDTSPADTALGTGLRRSNLSAALRSLVDKGMVERLPDPKDGRSALLRATPLAEQNIGRLHRFWADRLTAAIARSPGSPGVSDADLSAVVAVLELIDAGIRNAAGPGA